MEDIIGTALLDYYNGNYSEDIITETNISEEDELPLPYLFRDFNEMPEIEQKALKFAKGKVLDVGCGAGGHALYLQEKGFDVLGIDTSEGAIEVCKLRGLKNAKHIDLLQLKNEKFDSILMLMNGTGIFQNLETTSKYLQHLKSLLHPKGQILIDSSDLQYMYDATEEGGILVPADRYYGELEFTMRYKEMESEPFEWLYLDEKLFEALCVENNLHFEVIERGENFDYLARIRPQRS
ncbi:class I SAM-dependent methyltransferase [Aequorivita viscosa]|uniref:Methyltransferase domain-containing protein n=1 Tax=Aequorivita viscosa TaxID=797419 RepID=A0A1M6AZ05_9FLAO|nr:class I SAM-dependent methyltransferase [Aequorivita viscosa]SDW31500.1 Methyltransferase domain-containing protein [Aequorivita viscosa]SHI41700.1 Methyltransferase domain-containing protein [Aequorivita viscosa]